MDTTTPAGGWARQDLDALGGAGEIEVAASRADGSLWPDTTIWVVRVGDDLYVRSYRGADGGWYRHALQSRHGRIRTGGLEPAVTFDDPDGADGEAIDAAYRRKYGRSSYVDAMVTAEAAATTLRIAPGTTDLGAHR